MWSFGFRITRLTGLLQFPGLGFEGSEIRVSEGFLGQVLEKLASSLALTGLL